MPEMDKAIERLAGEFAAGISDLSENQVLRGGLVQAALNAAIWALYERFKNQSHEIVEHLELMTGLVQQQALQDGAEDEEDGA